MARAKATAKGQLTIPKTIKDKPGIKTGDYIIIKETSTGYMLEKKQDDDRFNKYVGFLNREAKSDDLIRELRGQ